MKKSFLVLLCALFVSASAYAYSEGTVGPNRKESSGGQPYTPVKVIQLVRFPEDKDIGVALSKGEVVLWDVISDDGVTVNRGSAIGLTASNDAVAGVVVSTTIPTADQAGTAATDYGHRNWGYIQTYGYCSAVMIDTSNGNVAAGQGLRASASSGYAVGAQNDGGKVSNGSLGFSYDAVTSGSNSNEAFIRTR